MIIDPGVLPGLVLLAAELAVLAAVGYVVVRVALRQDDELSALAQGMVVGPALWGIVVNFVMYAVPGLAGAAVGWVLVLGITGVLAWRVHETAAPVGAHVGRVRGRGAGARLGGSREPATGGDCQLLCRSRVGCLHPGRRVSCCSAVERRGDRGLPLRRESPGPGS